MSAFATRQTLPLVDVTTHAEEERRWSCQDCDWSGTAVDAGLEPGDFLQHCPACRQPRGERANLEARTYPELDTFDDCFERLRALVAQCDPEQIEAMRRRMFDIGNEIIAEAGTESGDALQCARYDAGELPGVRHRNPEAELVIHETLSTVAAYNEACATCGLPADIHLGPADPPVPTPHGTWGDRNKCRQFVRCDPPRAAYGQLDLEHAITPAEMRELHACGLGSESSGESIRAALREMRAEEPLAMRVLREHLPAAIAADRAAALEAEIQEHLDAGAEVDDLFIEVRGQASSVVRKCGHWAHGGRRCLLPQHDAEQPCKFDPLRMLKPLTAIELLELPRDEIRARMLELAGAGIDPLTGEAVDEPTLRAIIDEDAADLEARQPDRTETWTADYGVVRAGAHVIIDGHRYRIMRTRPELPQPGDRYELDLEDLGEELQADVDLEADADGVVEVTLPADKGPHTNALQVGSTRGRDGPQFLEEPTREELEDDEDLGR